MRLFMWYIHHGSIRVYVSISYKDAQDLDSKFSFNSLHIISKGANYVQYHQLYTVEPRWKFIFNLDKWTIFFDFEDLSRSEPDFPLSWSKGQPWTSGLNCQYKQIFNYKCRNRQAWSCATLVNLHVWRHVSLIVPYQVSY